MVCLTIFPGTLLEQEDIITEANWTAALLIRFALLLKWPCTCCFAIYGGNERMSDREEEGERIRMSIVMEFFSIYSNEMENSL